MNVLRHKFNDSKCFNPNYARFSIMLNIKSEERGVSTAPTIIQSEGDREIDDFR